MKKTMSGLLATVLATSFAAASVVPVAAAPTFYPKAPEANSGIEQVQYDPYLRPRRVMRMDRDDRRYRIVRRGDIYYMNGHRGYRDYRPGYRRYNDWWFPAGAFIAGAIIGGALSQPRYVAPRYGVRAYGDAHVQWCYDRYRSYRAWDNTYQPYNGPRRQCYSPYS